MVGGGSPDVLYRNTERCRKKWGERAFVDKSIHASIANHYNSEGSVSLHATVQSKSSNLKILQV